MKMKSDVIESVRPMLYFYGGLDKYGRGDFVALVNMKNAPKITKIKFQHTNIRVGSCKHSCIVLSVSSPSRH